MSIHRLHLLCGAHNPKSADNCVWIASATAWLGVLGFLAASALGMIIVGALAGMFFGGIVEALR